MKQFIGKVLCGTGHRPPKLGGYMLHAKAQVLELAVIVLSKLMPTQLISGMALGWDMALADAANTLNIPYIAAVPFEGQDSRWTGKDKKYYMHLLKGACQVVHVCDPGFAAWKMQKRNEWMVDNAEVVLALWDGVEQGGTWNCVRYAREQNKPVVNCWNKYADLTAPPPYVEPPAPKTTVVNLRKEYYTVYIGRAAPGEWAHDMTDRYNYGNPFSTMPDSMASVRVSSHKEAITAYKQWLQGTHWHAVEPARRQWILDTLHELKGKTLGCFCKPKPCHGDILVEMLEGPQ